MRIIPDFFGKKNGKEKETLQKLKQEIEKTKKEKEELKRQLSQPVQQQFDNNSATKIQKTTDKPKNTLVKTSKKPAKKSILSKKNKPLGKKVSQEEKPLSHQVSTFWSKPINRYYINDQWYFSLEDIIKVIEALEYNQIIEKLKKDEELNSVFQPLKIIENNQEKIIDLISVDGFLKILPFLQKMEKIPPGPFLGWLKQTAESPIPSPEKSEKIN